MSTQLLPRSLYQWSEKEYLKIPHLKLFIDLRISFPFFFGPPRIGNTSKQEQSAPRSPFPQDAWRWAPERVWEYPIPEFGAIHSPTPGLPLGRGALSLRAQGQGSGVPKKWGDGRARRWRSEVSRMESFGAPKEPRGGVVQPSSKLAASLEFSMLAPSLDIPQFCHPNRRKRY